MECEGSHFSTGGHFSPPGLGVMTRFLQTKNDPFGRRKWTPVTFLRRKMTGGRFSMGVVTRRYTGPSGRIGFFFITESFKYRGFCDKVMLNNGFRDNYMNYASFRLSLGFCHKFTLNSGFRDNYTLQEEQPDSFIVILTLWLGYLAIFTLDWFDKPVWTSLTYD